MANTENIEAKLCAYVDGELDEAGRAEIEAHLVANPQHRQLMEELRGQRDLLRDLPRVSAPGDLLETVNSQLERSALLDGAGGEPSRADIAGRISPWPKIMSIAAVLTMAIGLFAVIYYVLPQNNAKNREYATGVMRTKAPAGPTTARSLVSKDAATQPSGEMQTLTVADLPRGKAAAADETDRARKLDNRADTIATAAGAPATQTDVFDKAGPVESKGYAGGATFTNIFADAETEEKIKRSGAVPTDSLVMVVASADPSQAQGEVQKYLEDNKIHWEPVTEKVPQLDLKESQVLSGSRLGRTQMHLKDSTDSFAAKGGAGAGSSDYKQQEAARSKNEQAGAPTVSQQAPQQQQEIALAPAAAPPPNPSSPKIASNAAPQPPFDLGAATAPAAPAEQRQELQQKDGKFSPQREALQQQVQQPTFDLQQQQAGGGGNSSQLIVARGLTRKQVSELNDNLSTQNAGRVYNYRRSGDNFTPTKDLSIAQTAAPPAPATPALVTATATTQPAASPEKTKLAEDVSSTNGIDRTTTATAPVGQKIAAGDVALAQKPADDLAKKMNDAISVTTQPAGAAATTAPAPAAIGAIAVAGPSTHPADERLDVVICIQPPALGGLGRELNTSAGAGAATTAPSLNAPGAVAPNAAVAPTTSESESAAPNDTPPSDSSDQAK